MLVKGATGIVVCILEKNSWKVFIQFVTVSVQYDTDNQNVHVLSTYWTGSLQCN